MNCDFPRLNISDDEKLWLEKLYQMYQDGKLGIGYDALVRTLKTELLGKIPNDFDQKSIDYRLVQGVYLTLLGIWHIYPECSIIPNTENIIFHIREKLLKDTSLNSINAVDISRELAIPILEVSFILRLINQLGQFWSSGSGDNTGGMTSIVISIDSFDEYLKFNNLETLIKRFFDKNTPKERSLAKRIHDLSDKVNTSACNFKPIFKTIINQIDPKLCFVLMPFNESWSERVYKRLIRNSVEELGLQCLRADNLTGQIIIEDIWAKINQCAFIIADVTGRNANVMYELGIVHTIGKPAILITQEISNIPFDFSHLRHYEYKDNSDGIEELSTALPMIIKEIYKEHYNNDLTIS